jgi:hypothetical protein
LEILDNCKYQRDLKQGIVEKYSKLMTDGEWRSDNGTTIIYDWDGNLRDGQHRLWGVVESGVTVEFDIIYNMDPEAIRTIDVGSKRSGGDTLVMELKRQGKTINHASAIANALRTVVAEVEYGNVYSDADLSNEDQWAAFQKYEDIVASAAFVYKKGNLANKTICTALHFIFRSTPAYREMADSFFDKFVSGEDLESGSPILVCRNKFIGLRNQGKLVITKRYTKSCIIKCWELYKRNKSVKSISFDVNNLPTISYRRKISGIIRKKR